ncbi:type IV toxin-antitoxin system AbiEi family antitoxin domain-containing protein [Microbacteriaceae bacterium VKM Ac-2855]|nr:type IV toxin-antitoxin system AbiEi family antitoxin domain-containing protein [Microbacteriaceae bacterium VKM Ac-2855]
MLTLIDLIDLLAETGGFISTAQLTAAKIPRAVVTGALRDELIVRVRRGWYALASAPEADRRAVAAGGVLSCVSLLAEKELWVVNRPTLHVAVSPSAAVAPSKSATLHWKKWSDFGHESLSRDRTESAILHMLTCIPGEDAVVTMDSAVNSKTISLGDLDGLRSLAPVGKRRLFDLVDPAAQSGLETRIRLAARGMRVQVRSQVLIPGVGHVDNLLGERLVIESDGDRFHSTKQQRMIDRRRDAQLVDLEYLPMRLDHEQIMDDWPRQRAIILGIIRRGEHLWSPQQRRRRNLG